MLLSERYITDRFLPDKAIDLIDEACSDVNLENPHIWPAGPRCDKELADLRQGARGHGWPPPPRSAYAPACRRSRSRGASAASRSSGQLDAAAPTPALTVENLANVIELWTKIPASQIQER